MSNEQNKQEAPKTNKAIEQSEPIAESSPAHEPEVQPEPTLAEPKPDTAKTAPAMQKPSNNKNGRGLIGFALLLAVVSLGLSGWQYQQQLSLSNADELPSAIESNALQLSTLQEQLQAQTAELTRLREHLAELPSAQTLTEQERALRHMQSAHQAFSMRFEAAFGNTRQDWRLAEAEHLLRMAMLRLSAMQDINSARHLVEGADQILYEQDDVAAYPAREAIAQALADLNAMPKLDHVGLFVRLGALQQQVRQLEQILPSFEPSLTEKITDAALWRQWLDTVSDYVRLDFNSPDDVRPLLSSQEITHIRLALSLAIEQAQWSALNGQQQAYDQAIGQGISLLQHYFASDNSQAQALLAQLSELQGQTVSQAMPDISSALIALQAYIADRTLEYRTRSEVQAQ